MKKINIACIIDDDPIYIFGTKKIMQMADFCTSFLVYNDGQKALNGLKKILVSGSEVPEIILLDLNMPRMDGWEFLDEFVNIPNNKKITVFIVTSSIDPLDIEKAKNYQTVSNYIIKPVTPKALTEMVQLITLHKNY